MNEGLIARLEAAPVGNHELDRAMMQAIGYSNVGPGPDAWQEPNDGAGPVAMVSIGTQPFTTSLDVLVMRMPKDVGWAVGVDRGIPCASVGSLRIAKGATLPLALCIALLRAGET
jgi:hypothetical protein